MFFVQPSLLERMEGDDAVRFFDIWVFSLIYCLASKTYLKQLHEYKKLLFCCVPCVEAKDLKY